MRKLLMALGVLLASLTLGDLVVWFSWEGFEKFKSVVNEFSEETGIRVVVYNIRKIDQKLRATARASEKALPDVALIKNDQAARLDDILKDLSGLEITGVSTDLVGAFEVNGKLLAVPFYTDIGGVIFYNGSLVSDPSGRDFEDLFSLSSEGCSFMVPVYGKIFFQVFQRTFGSPVFENGVPQFLDDGTRKALEFLEWVKRKTEGCPNDRFGQMVAFRKGRVPLFMFASFLIPSLKDSVDLGIVGVPYVRSAGRKLVPFLDIKGFAVVRGRLRNEVREFLEFLQRPDVQYEFVKDLYKIPANVEARKKVSDSDELYKRLVEYEGFGVPTPSSVYSGVYYEAVSGVLNLLVSGRYSSLEELLRRAQDLVRERTR